LPAERQLIQGDGEQARGFAYIDEPERTSRVVNVPGGRTRTLIKGYSR
jgi:hypothetical protein